MGSSSGNQHIRRIDPGKDWIGGASTQLLRIRTIASCFGVGMGIDFALWSWSVMPLGVSVGLATFLVTSCGFLLFLRSVYLRSLRIQDRLLQFCHDVSAAVAD